MYTTASLDNSDRMRLFALSTVLLAAACATAPPEPQGQPDQTQPSAPPSGAPEAGDLAGQDGPRFVQAAAPGKDSERLTADEVAALGVPGYTEADVRFMQGMIPHHAQAIEMVALMPDRTTNPRLLRLGQRIDISQRDEIALMSRWLEERGESVPAGHGMGPMAGSGHTMHQELMPGMLTPEQMSQLAAAQGAEFDGLFLELMIGHHQGALTMVEQLFATPGGGQESWTNAFAADVDADQEMEIRRMRQMLDEIP